MWWAVWSSCSSIFLTSSQVADDIVGTEHKHKRVVLRAGKTKRVEATAVGAAGTLPLPALVCGPCGTQVHWCRPAP